jgi:translocation and assembly module TamA
LPNVLTRVLLTALLSGVAVLMVATPGAAQAQVPKEVSLSVEAPAVASGPVDALVLERWLKTHAQLWQFLSEPELTSTEFDDLLERAPKDIEALLQTRGYFNAKASITDAASPGLTVALGPVTTIASVSIAVVDATGNTRGDLTEMVRQEWPLQVGDTLTQSAWQSAKDKALNTLASRVYYQASISKSQAEVDPSTQRAKLSMELNSGPAFTFGPTQVLGATRYDTQQVLNLAQLAGLREGLPYSAQALFDAQRRIIDNGNYVSAFVTLTPSERRANAEQTLQVLSSIEVGEKPLQQAEASIGASTDSGPRLHLKHMHYRFPGLGWQATHTIDWQRDTQMLSSNWLSPLNARAWQWTGGLELKRQVDDNITTNAQHWRAGQTQSLDNVQRTYYMQWTQSKEQVRTQLPLTTSALSGHWAWSDARWDNPGDPQSGYALSMDLSAGVTLAQGAKPYLRGQTRWLWLKPFANPKSGRLATRVGLGAVVATDSTEVPSDELFLTGGDTSVRGYAVRSIGSTDSPAAAQGLVLPGRYMWLGGLEWQRPTTWGGDIGRVEQTFFVDAAAVSNRLNHTSVYLGTGTGLRFISPVGPMQVDLAYGHQTREWRLHLFVGIRF